MNENIYTREDTRRQKKKIGLNKIEKNPEER